MARSRRAAPRAAPKPAAKPPAPTRPAPPPAAPQQGGGMFSGLGRTIAEGMAFGTGSAIAHRAVGAVANSFSGNGDKQVEQQAPLVAQQETVQAPIVNPCLKDQKAFMDCLVSNNNDIGACQFYFDNFKQCEQQSQQFI